MTTTEDNIAVLERALERQKQARSRAETLLEERSRELYHAQQELNMRCEELKANQARLVQSERMAGLGHLAAGIAHEINNPLAFVTSNLTTLDEYVAVFQQLVDTYDRAARHATRQQTAQAAEALAEVERLMDAEDYEFVRTDITQLLAESKDGVRRVAEIVANLRNFANIDDAPYKELNVNECLESTLAIVHNELKYKCEVVKTFSELPSVYGCAAELHQAFMHLLVNAAQAIDERGSIAIDTAATAEHVVVTISDTGRGIDAAELPHLFDPFYTQNDVGGGKGLGLYTAYGVVVDKHHGTIDVDSTPGNGAQFTLRLPIAQANGGTR